ncbi:fructosamine kinase family protein [Emcibacter nanhaiensis]|uniref:fructosamine kinase family protein n=1 Tax=Emcibacter nanhaiensis TaxID=1505037 RepID=UPI0024821A9E|nr:fructosamine kinase family protein [Emcibacter nanhaiensis]
MFGSRVTATSGLSGGCLADLRLVRLENGREVVLKQGDNLLCEAFMLDYLRRHTSLPIPEVFHSAEDCILMEYMPGRASALDGAAEQHLASLVAELHEITAPQFGFERETVIGPLNQPNDQTADWCVFFRDRRLVHMADQGREAGKLPEEVYGRLLRLADRLEQYLGHQPQVSLLHGDLWGGNILSERGRVTGLVDPAIYYGDAEVELAFMTLFGTVGRRFFGRYSEQRPLDPDFFRTRKDIYLLYPLLVHVRLFGGSYVGQLDAILGRYL